MANTDLMSLVREAGFTGSAAQTMYAIALAESGGNAYAHNTNASTGDNSYGLAQINMLGAMGPQRLQEFGLNSANQLFDPLTNLKVAYKLSNGGQDFSPWTTYTGGAYQQYMGQSGAAVTQSAGQTQIGANGQALTAVPTPVKLTTAQYEQAVGYLGQMFNAIPELKGLLSKATSENQSTADFVNAIDGSNWYRTHSESFKQMFALQYSDPAEYKQQETNHLAAITEMANQMGVALKGTEAQQLASQSLLNGWSTQQQQAAIGGWYTRNDGSNPNQGGTAAATVQQINQLANDYGVPVTQATTNSWTQGILSGTQTMDGVKNAFMNSAQSLFPGLAPQIKAGHTVTELASPYISDMANLLEKDPASLSVQNTPLIKQALQGTSTGLAAGSNKNLGQPAQPGGQGSTGTPQAPMPLWQFENQVRADPQWQYTDNARQTTLAALHQIGTDFGYSA